MLDCEEHRDVLTCRTFTDLFLLLITITDLFLHGEQLDDVLVVEFLQNFELSHLDVERSQKTQAVEDFDGVQVSGFLPVNTNTQISFVWMAAPQQHHDHVNRIWTLK